MYFINVDCRQYMITRFRLAFLCKIFCRTHFRCDIQERKIQKENKEKKEKIYNKMATSERLVFINTRNNNKLLLIQEDICTL